ncbi:MAG: SRPBCC family protein [Solirubrobacterales bacterium]
MKPVIVSTSAKRAPEEAYEFLDVLANHEPFVDHLLTDWSFSGPARGVGAMARARTDAPGSQDWTEFEIVESGPGRIVEQAVGANGKRRTRGTYTLEGLSDGGTRLSFELEWLEAARIEQFFGPLTRAFVRRANAKSMRRLRGLLEAEGSA